MLKYSRAETGHLKNHLANRKSNTEYNSDSKKKNTKPPKNWSPTSVKEKKYQTL